MGLNVWIIVLILHYSDVQENVMLKSRNYIFSLEMLHKGFKIMGIRFRGKPTGLNCVDLL